MKNLKIAIAHYWLNQWRGGEKVIKKITEIFPNCEIYTLFLDKKIINKHLPTIPVYHSPYNFPFFRKKHTLLTPLYPRIINSLPIKKKYDLIITSESGPIKGIPVIHKTPSLCYVHSPMRYCYDKKEEYINSVPPFARPLLAKTFQFLKEYDLTTINKVDHYVANSENIKNKIKKYYQKEAEVIYPPISGNFFQTPLEELRQKQKRDIYLSLGAVTPYKRIDLLVKAFNRNGKKLVVIGQGGELEKLRKIAKPNIRFTGYLKEQDIISYIKRTKAFLFPGEEDFGMTPVEMAAMGVPVLAYGRGGVSESIQESLSGNPPVSGLFFQEQTATALNKVITRFEKMEKEFNPEIIRHSVLKFHERNFEKKIIAKINTII